MAELIDDMNSLPQKQATGRVPKNTFPNTSYENQEAINGENPQIVV